MENQSIVLLQLLRSLSQQKRIVWHRDDEDVSDDDIYLAKAGKQVFRVEFISLARTDEVGSDRTLARLNAFGVADDYCIGTAGYDLICEMLASSDPNWPAHRTLCQERQSVGIQFLWEYNFCVNGKMSKRPINR